MVADANWYSTENLFSELDQPEVETLLLKCSDVINAIQVGQKPPWDWFRGIKRHHPNRWEQEFVLPPGWMKRFPKLGMRPIARSIRRWRRQRELRSTTLVITYPYYAHLADLIQPDQLVYLNLDDYGLYWPDRKSEIERLENEVVRRADVTACVAQVRVEELVRRVPEAGDRIRHLPHGAPSIFRTKPRKADERPAELDKLSGPVLGYVGGLEDRVDWVLLDRIAAELPDATLLLVGNRPRPPRRSGLQDESMVRCIKRPNVRCTGWRSQQELGPYLHSFDLSLIPYRADHPFNHASCPTKIMDYMASGKPIVSTSIPECRHYPGLIEVAEDHDSFLRILRTLQTQEFNDGQAALRWERAASQSCQATANRLLNWLTHEPLNAESMTKSIGPETVGVQEASGLS